MSLFIGLRGIRANVFATSYFDGSLLPIFICYRLYRGFKPMFTRWPASHKLFIDIKDYHRNAMTNGNNPDFSFTRQ